MTDLDNFYRVLLQVGFQPSTAKRYTLALRHVAEIGGENAPITDTTKAAARRWDAWKGKPPEGPVTQAVNHVLRRLEAPDVGIVSRVTQKRAGQTRRLHEAKSIPDDEWQRLVYHTLVDDTIESIVLGLLYATGLRVGDALRIDRLAVERGETTGRVELTAKGGERRILPWAGAPDTWASVAALFRRYPRSLITLADVVADETDADVSSSGAAYKALERALRRYAAQAGITERIYLHRIRRTVAVQALRLTEDPTAVQQLLGHRSLMTTARYLDEARPEALAGLQSKLRDTFLNPKPKRTR